MAKQQKADPEDKLARYEQELSEYLQERIKPGLNSGAIPLLARSIAKDLAQREPPNGASPAPEAGETGEAGKAEDDGESPDFEADMRELQSELGEDWILRFSVQGDNAWLTAEKADGTQRVEAQTAAVLTEVVGRLNEGGGRSA